jgi:RNA polymerase sigma-70 factor (ECF subfamily)
MRHDPLRDPGPLIRRVYSYVAYRIGEGPDAEDVTSTVFERALRYRKSYDPKRGAPLAWLLGIARRCIDDFPRAPQSYWDSTVEEQAAPADLEGDSLGRLQIADALNRLDGRSRDLIALRYGADLTARQIGEVLGMKTNAVEVALHRIHGRLREELQGERAGAGSAVAGAASQLPFGNPAGRPGPT